MKELGDPPGAENQLSKKRADSDRPFGINYFVNFSYSVIAPKFT